MKNISLLVLFFSSLIFTSCKDDEFRAAIRCKINGKDYLWDNRTKSYAMYNNHFAGNYVVKKDTSLQIFFENRFANFEPINNNELELEIKNFDGIGTYTNNMSMNFYFIIDSVDYSAEYDSIINGKVIISNYNEDKHTISGRFEFDLFKSENNLYNSIYPQTISITEGYFHEMKLVMD